MDPGDFRRYEKFMDNFKPVLIILLVAGLIISGYYFKIDDKVSGKKITLIDRTFNFCVDTYDKWTGRDKKYNPTDTIKVYNQDTPVQETFNIDYRPNYLDSINKVDTNQINPQNAQILPRTLRIFSEKKELFEESILGKLSINVGECIEKRNKYGNRLSLAQRKDSS
jgi:hypothetical protein